MAKRLNFVAPKGLPTHLQRFPRGSKFCDVILNFSCFFWILSQTGHIMAKRLNGTKVPANSNPTVSLSFFVFVTLAPGIKILWCYLKVLCAITHKLYCLIQLFSKTYRRNILQGLLPCLLNLAVTKSRAYNISISKEMLFYSVYYDIELRYQSLE